jgi:hypothetical protein
MRRASVVLLIAVPMLVFIGGCDQSDVETRQEKIREQRRMEADQALAEKRREEEEHAEAGDAAAAFREWLMHLQSDPTVPVRMTEGTFDEVSLHGETLVLVLSTANEDEAVELCNFVLTGWEDRETHGVNEIQVVSVDDESTLARSTHLPTGAHVCE